MSGRRAVRKGHRLIYIGRVSALSVRYKWSTKCRLNGSTSGDPNGTSGRPVVGPLILSHFLSRLGTKRLIDCWTRRPSKGRWKPKRIRRIGAHTDSQKKVMESSLFGWSVGECVCVGSMGFTGPFFFKTLHKPTDKVADTFGINGAEEKDSNSKNQRTQTHTKKTTKENTSNWILLSLTDPRPVLLSFTTRTLHKPLDRLLAIKEDRGKKDKNVPRRIPKHTQKK